MLMLEWTDRVGRCDAGGNDEGRQERESRDDAVDERGRYEPAKDHHRAEQERDRLPVLAQVGLGQLCERAPEGSRFSFSLFCAEGA